MWVECPDCAGHGDMEYDDGHSYMIYTYECPHCEGAGSRYVVEACTCEACAGYGQEYIEDLEVCGVCGGVGYDPHFLPDFQVWVSNHCYVPQ